MVKHLPTDRKGLLEAVLDIARVGGEAALVHYGKPVEVEYKADSSPLTRADKDSHGKIVSLLERLTPEIPVLSEESAAGESAGHRDWEQFWCVDPLDGSKEFLKTSGQFTVNIALVDGHEPVLGVVYVPVSGVSYFACHGDGAYVMAAGGSRRGIQVREADLEQLVIVASRDHAGPEVNTVVKRFPGARLTSMGSALKFCLVAEGKADFYVRTMPTMEWDTAAAQCVVEAAGGAVTDLSGRRLTYNKADLRNPALISYGDHGHDWPRLIAG